MSANFKMVASAVIKDFLKEVTRSYAEGLRDSNDEENNQKTKAIELAVNFSAECSDLRVNISHFLNKRQKDI